MSDFALDEIMERHNSRNGLCNWCACEWPCDAYQLAEFLDTATCTHEKVSRGHGVAPYCIDCGQELVDNATETEKT